MSQTDAELIALASAAFAVSVQCAALNEAYRPTRDTIGAQTGTIFYPDDTDEVQQLRAALKLRGLLR